MADGLESALGGDGRKRPWYLTLVIVALVLAVAVGGTLAVLDMVGSSALSREIKAIRDSGQPVTLEDLNALRPDVPDDRNGALIIQALADRLEKLGKDWQKDESLPLLGRGDLPVPGEVYPAATVAAIRSAREQGAALLVEIDRLREPLRGCFPDRAVGSMGLPQLSPCRSAAKLKALDCLAKACDGNLDAAAMDSLVIVNLAGVVHDEGSLIASLVSAACDHLALSALQRSLAAGEVDAATLAELGQGLDVLEDSRSFAATVQAERALVLETCEVVLRDPSAAMGGGMAGAAPPLTLYRYLRGLRRLDEAKMLQLIRPLAAPEIPIAEGIARAKACDAQVQKLPAYRLLPRLMLPSYQRTFELQGLKVAAVRCARVALAAERYRLGRGEWPATLEDLVPEYISTLPLDPFDELPLRCLHDEGGVTVYSVGENLADDGGQVWAKSGSKRRPFDAGFRLLEPGARGFRIAGPSPE